MNPCSGNVFRFSAAAMLLLGSVTFASCSATPKPAPPPPEPIVYAAPADTPPPDEWNLFPDPTTGNVDVYHKGGYIGSVTGDEPANQDPPIPHPVQTPSAE